MSNTPISNNANANQPTTNNYQDHLENPQQTNNGETAGLADQTNSPNLDSMTEDVSPWIPDNQDGIKFIHPSQLGPNKHLTIMEDILKNEQSEKEVPPKDIRKPPIVPKDLPVFQLRGQHRHDKRRDSYDSAKSFLDNFEVHLAAYELEIEGNWQYAVKYGIPNNQDLVFNYLCSLNRQYRKKAWTLIANHHGDQILDKLEPVVQMVQSLAASETSSDNNSTSDSNSDSEEEADSDGDISHNKRRRTSNIKSKGKEKAPLIPKKNAYFLHPKSNHTHFDCKKLKEVLRMTRNNNSNWQNNNNNKFGSRSFFGPSNKTYYNNGAGPSNVNLCRFCRHVPYIRGHECQEMLRARRSNINNNNNNNTVHSRMTHLSSQVEDMLSVNDDELMETSSNNNK
ncbi:hypothetical protein INT45_005874, partial [Circinella minor]